MTRLMVEAIYGFKNTLINVGIITKNEAAKFIIEMPIWSITHQCKNKL